MIKFYKNNKENIDKILMFLIFLFIIFIFFRFVAKYFAPFIFGYILSVLLFPIAEFLHKKFKISKGSCSFIAISILLIFVGSLGTGIVMKIIYEAKAFSNDAPGYVQSVIKNVENLRTFFENRTENLPSWLKTQVSNNFDNIISILTSVLGDGVKSGSMGIFKKIPSVIMTVVFGFISCFFILKDFPGIVKGGSPSFRRKLGIFSVQTDWNMLQ